jgi:hypothetical protein
MQLAPPLHAGMVRQYARFEFPFDKAAAAKGGKRFFSGHFDAYCPWRLDDSALVGLSLRGVRLLTILAYWQTGCYQLGFLSRTAGMEKCQPYVLDTDAFAPDVGYTRMHYIMKETDPETGNRQGCHSLLGVSLVTWTILGVIN